MATKSSIHIKPCNIASSRAHNRRTASICVISRVRIYVVPELSTDNEQWINPDFSTPELRTHYDNIKQMVKGKDRTCHAGKGKGTQGERMERLSRWQDAHPSVKEYCLSDRTPHWLMYANSVKSAKDAGASLRYRFSCIKTKGIGWTVSRKRKTKSFK